MAKATLDERYRPTAQHYSREPRPATAGRMALLRAKESFAAHVVRKIPDGRMYPNACDVVLRMRVTSFPLRWLQGTCR
jgi:hypothetical protein